jgi:hypothetical protein
MTKNKDEKTEHVVTVESEKKTGTKVIYTKGRKYIVPVDTDVARFLKEQK